MEALTAKLRVFLIFSLFTQGGIAHASMPIGGSCQWAVSRSFVYQLLDQEAENEFALSAFRLALKWIKKTYEGKDVKREGLIKQELVRIQKRSQETPAVELLQERLSLFFRASPHFAIYMNDKQKALKVGSFKACGENGSDLLVPYLLGLYRSKAEAWFSDQDLILTFILLDSFRFPLRDELVRLKEVFESNQMKITVEDEKEFSRRFVNFKERILNQVRKCEKGSLVPFLNQDAEGSIFELTEKSKAITTQNVLDSATKIQDLNLNSIEYVLGTCGSQLSSEKNKNPERSPASIFESFNQ